MMWLLFVFQHTHIIAHSLIVHTHPTGPSQEHCVVLIRRAQIPQRCVVYNGVCRAPLRSHWALPARVGRRAVSQACRLRGGQQVTNVFKCISVLGLRGMHSGSGEGKRQERSERSESPCLPDDACESLSAVCSGRFRGGLRQGPWRPSVGPAPDGSLVGN